MLERISTLLTAAKPALPANAAWLVLAIFCGSALAAGVREEAIGIAFPERLVSFELKGRTQFPQSRDGATIEYQSDSVRGAIYAYNAGLAAIPAGVGSPVIHRHFQETVMALQRAAGESSAKTTPVRPGTMSSFPGCGPQFMWRADEIRMGDKSVVSRTYLAGFNNHFVKLRVSHLRASGKEADEFVQQVRRILGKCG